MDRKELAQYVEKLQLGDSSAFEVIYNETNNQVYNLLYSYTKNEYASFDLMQETYLTVNSKIGTIKDPSAIKSWINRIAINKANRFFEKNKKEILLSEEGQSLFETQLEEDEEFLPQEILDSKEKQKIIKDIIDNLPIEQKTAVYLYYFDELSLTEVATDMECSEGTVKSRLNYARKKIKAEVDTWEKKGTKLYGTGVPVLLLLLKEQLGIENISLGKANTLLKDMLTNIGGSSEINTIPDIVNGNNKLANTIDGTTKAARKVLGIKSIVAGVITVVAVGSLIFINVKSVAANFQETALVDEKIKVPVIEKQDTIISYSSLNIEDGIRTIDVIGDDIVIANDCLEDRCIEIAKKDSIENGQAEVKIINLNGNEKIVNAKVVKNNLSTDNVSSGKIFFAYRNFTDRMIVGINDYDKNIVQINNNPDEKNIEIKLLKEGHTTAKIVDSNGKKGELQLTVTYDEMGVLVDDDTSKKCK